MGLLRSCSLLEILQQEKVTLDEVERIRDDAVRRGDLIVFEEEDLACMSELLGLGPRASFSDIVTALRAFVASYQRSRGLPVVRLVPQAGKPN